MEIVFCLYKGGYCDVVKLSGLLLAEVDRPFSVAASGCLGEALVPCSLVQSLKLLEIERPPKSRISP